MALLDKFINWAPSMSFEVGRKKRSLRIAIFSSIVSPVIFIAVFSYTRTYNDLTDFTLSRRESIAYLAAATLRQQFDRLQDIGISLATRPRVYELIGEGKWDEAIQFLARIPKDFPLIDRLFLAAPDGTLVTDLPVLAGVRGKNFAFRDWYQGVSAGWKPYISEVYKRTAVPQTNVVAVAIPIRTENQKVVGILVLQVQLDTLLEWSRRIEVGRSGFVYFVDRKGRVAAHPRFQPQADIVDYSSVPVVQKALRGEHGVAVLWNPFEREGRVNAYAQVPGYGWGVIVAEPKEIAFESRDKSLRFILGLYGSVFLLTCGLAYLILYTITSLKQREEQIKKLNEDLKLRTAELEATNKELEAFSYSVSHDLRAPLRAIDGFSRILLEKQAPQLSGEGQRHFRLVRDNAKQMGQLIDDLLTFSRLGRQPVKKQRVMPADIARLALTDLGHEQADPGVKIAITDLPACEADPSLLKQVYVNLLSNALKFTQGRESAQIQIGSLQTDGELVYLVKDNGVGFDMQYADKLFGVFLRLHRACRCNLQGELG